MQRIAYAHLKDASGKTLPGGPGLHLLALLVDEVPVELTAAGINVHLSGPEPSLTLPEVSSNPESTDDEEGEVGHEEVFSGTNLLASLEAKR